MVLPTTAIIDCDSLDDNVSRRFHASFLAIHWFHSAVLVDRGGFAILLCVGHHDRIHHRRS